MSSRCVCSGRSSGIVSPYLAIAASAFRLASRRAYIARGWMLPVRREVRESIMSAQPRGAIVTGASRGIGLAIARALVERGDRVVITGRDAASVQQAASDLGGEPVALAVAGKAHDAAHQDEVV